MKISVVIPVFNEKQTIREVLDQVNNAHFDKEIIVVDDGSYDGTKEILAEIGEESSNDIKILYQEKNQGKGAAVSRGFQHVTGDIVIIQDADLEYAPKDYEKLIQPIIDGEADVVYGSRFLGGPHRVLFFWHYVGNKLLTGFSNIFTNLNLSDMETGYKAFRAEVIKNIEIKAKRFGFEPEITVKVAKKKYRIFETPISYRGRDYSEGKKINWKDGFAAFYWILRFRFFD